MDIVEHKIPERMPMSAVIYGKMAGHLTVGCKKPENLTGGKGFIEKIDQAAVMVVPDCWTKKKFERLRFAQPVILVVGFRPTPEPG